MVDQYGLLLPKLLVVLIIMVASVLKENIEQQLYENMKRKNRFKRIQELK
jgi:hypothetical protein